MASAVAPGRGCIGAGNLASYQSVHTELGTHLRKVGTPESMGGEGACLPFYINISRVHTPLAIKLFADPPEGEGAMLWPVDKLKRGCPAGEVIAALGLEIHGLDLPCMSTGT